MFSNLDIHIADKRLSLSGPYCSGNGKQPLLSNQLRRFHLTVSVLYLLPNLGLTEAMSAALERCLCDSASC